jgi:hypothetical protein
MNNEGKKKNLNILIVCFLLFPFSIKEDNTADFLLFTNENLNQGPNCPNMLNFDGVENGLLLLVAEDEIPLLDGEGCVISPTNMGRPEGRPLLPPLPVVLVEHM